MAAHASPPTAYTSESALAAAVCPNNRGSLPSGLRTSTVCTRAIPAGGALTMTASSLCSKPCSTRPSGSGTPGRAASTCSRNSGAVFAAHPAALARSISRNVIATPPSRENNSCGTRDILPCPASAGRLSGFRAGTCRESFHLCQSTSLFCPFRDVDATFTETPTRKMVFHTGKLYAVPSPVQSTAGNGFRQMLHPDVSGIR